MIKKVEDFFKSIQADADAGNSFRFFLKIFLLGAGSIISTIIFFVLLSKLFGVIGFIAAGCIFLVFGTSIAMTMDYVK